jgi:hypothetical protein
MMRVAAVALLCCLVAFGCGRGDDVAPVANLESLNAPIPLDESYFPLAVGNSWTFRCSAEGEFQFEKTLRVTSTVVADDTLFYRAEMTRNRDEQAAVSYLFESPDSTVSRASVPARSSGEPLIRSNAVAGDRVGTLIAAPPERTTVPATGEAAVLRVENFPAEDPNLQEEKRLEWVSRSYAVGVGPVIEADGLGNECVLVKYHIVER